MAWYPRAGETFLYRGSIDFATGMAAPVSGMRFFRDTERRDIQHELPGWPEGPRYAVRGRGGTGTRRAGRGAFVGLQLVSGFILSAVTLGTFGPSLRGRPEDPDNEVEDFPVLWAAPGAAARKLPWQLDPKRRAKGYVTHAIVTDRRLVFVGFPDEDTSQDKVLGEFDRVRVARVERQKFSSDQRDIRVDFDDGSWCRLHSDNENSVEEFVRHLEAPPQLVPEEQLTPGQLATIADCVASHARVNERDATDYDGWIVTLRPSGNFFFQAWSDRAVAWAGAVGPSVIMDRDGNRVYDPGDFASADRRGPAS
ncbi:hypothetical protein [Streptomyces sp. NPDC004134]|uniref:hypothetical protein n=1 Tax=Streptomyces sp. NPDC004134 TaxID=3364691 RepID=UPI0036C2502F